MANPQPADRDKADSPRAELDGLLIAVGGGDRDAFTELFDLVAPRVLGLTTTVLRNQALASETTQDVMVEVWEKAALFDGSKGSAVTWILVMARRRAIDRVRSEEASRARDHKVGSMEGRAADLDLDELSTRIDSRELPAMLDVLTPMQRTAIILVYYEGLTASQVAARLDIPLGTAKTRIRDALNSLRAELGVTT